jgi:hypothetical protein
MNDYQMRDALRSGDLDYVMKNLSPKDINDVWEDYTPLIIAMRSQKSNVASYLLSRGASVDMQPDRNWAALHYATFYGNKDGINLLINNGCNIALKTKHGQTALRLAISTKQFHIAKLLIDRGCPYEELTDDPTYSELETQQRVKTFIEQRNGLRSSIITLLGFRRRGIRVFGQNNRDVCTLIMKHVWSMRFEWCNA